MTTDIRETLDTKRFGFVLRYSYPGEAWHIIQEPPTVHGTSDGPTLCGYRPIFGRWSTVAGWVGGKVCTRCQRIYQRGQPSQEPQP